MRKKFIFLILTILILPVTLSSCTISDNIYIIGDVEETVEVNSTFLDKGVCYPSNYTLITSGQIDTSILKRQMIKYSVYAKDGSLVKEMHRYVNVVDTTAPRYQEIENKNYYAGFTYHLDDFITEYSDNYDQTGSINVSQTSFTFKTSGKHQVNIIFSDSSGNTNTYFKDIDVQFDLDKLINEIYKNQTYKVTSGTTGIGSKYTSVAIDSKTSFSYYDTGSLHYLQTVPTNLGTRASIQISSNYGEFNKANISFHISGWLDLGFYSVGFATIDATQNSVIVNQFSSVINNLNLDTTSMLKELNANLSAVLKDFQSYMNDTLHLELK